MLDTFRDMVELRRLRLDAVGGHVSLAMWAFVLAGGAVAIASSYLFAVRDPRLHLLMVGLLALIIGLVVVLIAAYDSPFVGGPGHLGGFLPAGAGRRQGRRHQHRVTRS